MILIIFNMEHFWTEENQQNCPLMHQDVLNTTSGNDESGLGKNILFGQILDVVSNEK